MATIETIRPDRSAEMAGDTTHADRDARTTMAALLVWSVVVVLGAALVYFLLVATGEKRLDGVPLHAAFDPSVGLTTLLPFGVLAAVIAATPRIQTLQWCKLLCTWWVVGVVWALALAAARGFHRITAPLEHASEYAAVLPRVGGVGAFLATFVDRIASYPTHVQGHPPGFVLVAWGLQQLGAAGAVPLALLVVVVGAGAVPLVLICVRDVVDEEWARRAAPFLAVGPAAIWVATSADAFFTGVGAAAVTLLVIATTRRGTTRGTMAVAGGALFGVCAILSYGLVLLGVVPLVVAIARRAYVVITVGVVAAAGFLGVFALTGFWWLDGLFATRDRYFAGIASRRPYELFLVVNVSILAIALGPAIAVALVRLRDRSCWFLVGGALLALALADITGMSKSEVERIWLPFIPFVVVSAGVLGRARGADRLPTLHRATGWLALQGCAAILLESVVRTAW